MVAPGQRDRRAEHAVGGDVDVRKVAGMWARGIVEPVLFRGWVPVRPGAREIRRVAAADGVDVDAVEAVRQAGCIDPKAHAARGLPGAHAADRLAARVESGIGAPPVGSTGAQAASDGGDG